MKKKGTGMVMTIMLVSICGWVAIVVFVIKPDIGDGVNGGSRESDGLTPVESRETRSLTLGRDSSLARITTGMLALGRN